MINTLEFSTKKARSRYLFLTTFALFFAANTVCLAKKKSNNEYPIPLYTDPYENQMIKETVDLIYDINNSEKPYIKVGDFYFDEQTFNFSLQKNILTISWPENVFVSPKITFNSVVGSLLFERERKTDSFKSADGKMFAEIKNVEKQFLNLAARITPFRICLSEESRQGYQRLCSGLFVFKKNKSFELLKKEEKNYSQVIINDESKNLSGETSIAPEQKVKFYSSLNNGFSYEFSTINTKYNIRSIYLSDDQKIYIQILNDPTRETTNIKSVSTSHLPTTKEFISKPNESFLFLNGQTGGSFKVQFIKDRVPPEHHRIFLSHRTPQSTYSKKIKLLSWKPQEVSFPKSDDIDLDNNNEFVWHFASPEKFKKNRYTLNYLYKNEPYKSYFEIDREPSSEVTLRGSGVLSSQGAAPMAELTVSHWFEDLLGMTNYWISRQRWGVQLQYFQALSPITTDESNIVNLASLVGRLKYRLPPGIWGKDEAYGPILTYQNVSYGGSTAAMLGAGIFWGRMMPDLFEYLIGSLPFLNYPKWVDLELISYMTPLNNQTTLYQNLEVNFHGQVHWTKSFFGEAGFGYKSYHFYDGTNKKTAKLDTFYGLVGLGLRF